MNKEIKDSETQPLNPILGIFLETAEKARPALLDEGLSAEEIRRNLAHKAFLLGSSIQQVAEMNMQAGREQGMALAMQQMQQNMPAGVRQPQQPQQPSEPEGSEDKGTGLYL